MQTNSACMALFGNSRWRMRRPPASADRGSRFARAARTLRISMHARTEQHAVLQALSFTVWRVCGVRRGRYFQSLIWGTMAMDGPHLLLGQFLRVDIGHGSGGLLYATGGEDWVMYAGIAEGAIGSHCYAHALYAVSDGRRRRCRIEMKCVHVHSILYSAHG